MIARNIKCKRALCFLSVSPTNFRVDFPCVSKIPTSKWGGEPVYSALALWESIETVWYHKMWSVFWSSCLTLSHCHTHIWNCPTLTTSVPLLALASHYIGVLPLHPIFSRSTLSLTISLPTLVTIPHCLPLATSVPLLVPASRSASPSGGEGAGKLTRICFAILGLLGKMYIVYINLVGQDVAGKERQLQNSFVLHVL